MAVGLVALYPLLEAIRSVGSDLASSGEKLNGLGAALGGAMLVPLVLAAPALAGWWRRGRGRRAGWVALAFAAAVVTAEVVWLTWMGFS